MNAPLYVSCLHLFLTRDNSDAFASFFCLFLFCFLLLLVFLAKGWRIHPLIRVKDRLRFPVLQSSFGFTYVEILVVPTTSLTNNPGHLRLNG